MIGLRIGQRPFDESANSPSSTTLSGIREAKQAANIVRVAAKTASPIVSSVPKCRRSKASRSHPMDTVNGASGSNRSSSMQVGPLGAGGGRSMQLGESVIGGAGRMINKQPLDKDQVLLIVNDDHIKGGGVPIIGRRLPSKSAAIVARSNPGAPSYPQHHQHPSTDCLIISTTTGERSQPVAPMPAAAPVIGRRSHRMIQQQQQQQQQQQVGTSYPYYCHDYSQLVVKQSGAELTTPPVDNVRPTNRTQAHYKQQQQQPLSLIETQSYQVEPLVDLGGRIDSGAGRIRRHSNQRQQTNASSSMNLNESSTLMVDEYFLPPMEKSSSSRRLLTESKQAIQSSSGQRQLHQARQNNGILSTCSPMCSAQVSASNTRCLDDYQHQAPTCCSSPNCANQVAEFIEPPCCRPFEAEQACTLTCCTSSPIKTTSSCHKNHTHHRHHLQQSRPGGTPHQSSRSHRQVARSAGHNHHSTCQANGDTSQPLLMAASGKPPVAYRSSSCHDPRRVGSGSSKQQVAMLIGGAHCNVLPVHPKPKVLNHYLGSSSSRASAADHYLIERNSTTSGSFQSSSRSNCSAAGDPTVVTQMYESLAAELKAKLGDPKLAPILLPPKDYDTMSRKQGRLTGIELRRSTNPQLVGPAANRLASHCENAKVVATTTDGEDGSQATGAGEQQAGGDSRSALSEQPTTCKSNSSAGCGSSRSSGRSSGHDEPRSRSNSSSGLGSISIGAESPSSSKVSSNEELRQASYQSRLLASHGKYTRVNINNNNNNNNQEAIAKNDHQVTKIREPQVVDRKNPSPNGSDSGHSGSTRLDSGEEQKSIPLGTSNQFYGSKFSSTPSPSINSHSNINNNNNINSPDDAGASSKWPETKKEAGRGAGLHNHNPSKVSSGVLWNGRVEVPLKVNSAKNGNTYLATKQIIY